MIFSKNKIKQKFGFFPIFLANKIEKSDLVKFWENPEEYFTPEVMQALDEVARKEFSYGS